MFTKEDKRRSNREHYHRNRDYYREQSRAWAKVHPQKVVLQPSRKQVERSCKICGVSLTGTRQKSYCRLHSKVAVRENCKVRYHKVYRKERLSRSRCTICEGVLGGTKCKKYCMSCRVIGKRLNVRRWARIRGGWPARRGKDWDIQKYRALARDGYRCVRCGSGYEVRVHHKIPHRFTRDNRLSNLETLCLRHHSGCRVHFAKSLEECLGILRVSEEVPVST